MHADVILTTETNLCSRCCRYSCWV